MRINIREIEKFNSLLKKKFQQDSLPQVKGVALDSRLVQQDDFFIPLKGKAGDGHNHISSAIESGAALVVSENSSDNAMPVIKVGSTWQILRDLTLEWRRYFSCPFFGITGTNGKTTTKELLYHVLRDSMKVMRTEGNFNSTTGVPLTLFGSETEVDCCIIEMGASEPGEIATIAEMVQPELGLITNIGEAHIEYFESIERVSATKSALFTALPSNGKALINLDDPLISKMEVSCSQVSYSFNTSADFSGCWTNAHQFEELRVNDIPITIPVPSEAFGKNALAVFAAASQFDIPIEKIKEKIQSFQMPSGRGEIITLDKVKIINDSYNANLDSARAGIKYLAAMSKEKRKIAVIGDMLELGSLEKRHHSELGKLLSEKHIDAVFAYGKLSEYAIKAMNGTTAFHQFYDDKSKLIADLKNYLTDGDIIYLKGSRGMKMEEIITGLKT